MTKAFRRLDFKEESITDLVNTIKSSKPKKGSPEYIKQTEENLALWEKRNKKANSRISYLNKRIKEGKIKEEDLLKTQKELKRLKNYESTAHYRKVNGIDVEVVVQKTNISHIRNKLKRLKGEDYYYHVSDGFNKYKVKRSKIIKMKDNSFFINKMRKGVMKQIDKIRNKENLTPEEEKRLTILEEKLLVGIDFNKKLDKLGEKERVNLEEETEEGEDLDYHMIKAFITDDIINI